MTVDAPVPADAPVMVAWKAYQETEEFANTKRWASVEEHTLGSLWAAFYAGFYACAAPAPNPQAEAEALIQRVGTRIKLRAAETPSVSTVRISLEDAAALLSLAERWRWRELHPIIDLKSETRAG
jgi:hypothetical protein